MKTEKSTLPDTADEVYQSLVLPPEGSCFHCGEVLPKEPFFTEVLGKKRAMCCLGCQLASQSIVEAGLSQYYLDRREISATAKLPLTTNFDVYNHDDIKKQFVYFEDGGSTAELSVVGLRCSACAWLIESRLSAINGVKACQVNLTQQRMRVNWQESVCDIGQVLSAIHAIGYEAHPYRQDTHEAMMRRQNKKMLIRLGIAALGAMQAMMFSVGMYFGEFSGMLVQHRDFLRMVAFLVTLPVIFFAGLPFFQSAYRAVKARQVNMDVPVSIALLVSFFASVWATITQSGETYFDSVSMFVFFLLAGRYIEQNARLKASNLASDLVVIEPILVQRLTNDLKLLQNFYDKKLDGQKIDAWWQTHQDFTAVIKDAQNSVKTNEKILAQSVKVGDVVYIEAGMQIVADGVLLSKTATVSQSLLTGESDLIVKKCGDVVIGGSQNDAQPFFMLVTAEVDDSQIALIDRLMNRAMSEKPKIAQDADKMARWFVARVLLLSCLVFLVWWFIDKSEALWATVAVLVATCPCALSLATPIALTMATNRLATFGFLSTRGHTIQTLSEVTHVAFDKTGTLTQGQVNLLASVVADGYDEQSLLTIAAALEVGSKHPVAKALLAYSHGLHLPKVTNSSHHTAGGVEGEIDKKVYRIGHLDFVLAGDTHSLPCQLEENLATYHANMSVLLSAKMDNHWQVVARFYFNDVLRLDAKTMIDNLKRQDIIPIMLTGDPSFEALNVANNLGIDTAYHGLTPEDKVAHIKQLQEKGYVVLMVGDGINDAPVLAAANVSTAMAGAADLAQVSADSVLLGGKLLAIDKAIVIAKKTQTLIRQNLRWAVIYNSVILLPAALGYVPPWLAAIGMSLSSLFVVMNALRIKRS